MPIYEFSCQKCGSHIEILQGYDDIRPSEHDRCGGDLIQKFSIPSSFIGPQTVGSLAEKNTKGMSDDARRHYTEEIRTKKVRKSDKSLGDKPDLNKTKILERKSDVAGSKLKRRSG